MSETSEFKSSCLCFKLRGSLFALAVFKVAVITLHQTSENQRLDTLKEKRQTRKERPKPSYTYTYNSTGQLYCSSCDRVFKNKFGLASHIRAHARKSFFKGSPLPKSVGDVLIIPILGYLLLLSLVLGFYGTNKTYLILKLLCTVMIFILFILFITDFLTSILFIFGGYDDKRNAKLIRRYYKYNIAVLIVTILLIVTAIGLGVAISKWVVSDLTLHFILFGAYVVILVVQAYFILLLRSEVVKLQRKRAASSDS